MLRAMITPLTMYQLDNTVFDGITLPSRPFTDRGYDDLFLTGWDMDKTVFINNLLMETAELNVLYTNPEFFKFAVSQWAAKEKAVWQSLYETIFFKYNPIWNKDGTIKRDAEEVRDLANGRTVNSISHDAGTETSGNTRTTDATETTERDETSQRAYRETMDGTVTDEKTPGTTDTSQITYNVNENRDLTTANGGTITTVGSDDTDGTSETAVSAYDANTYQPREKTITHSENDTTQTVTDRKTVDEDGDILKTGTETTVLSHTGSDSNVTTYDTTKEINDDLNSHTDDVERNLDETVTDSGNRSNNRWGTDDTTESGTQTGSVETSDTTAEHGNIGVTTTQQMIQAERELVRFNIYDVIIESFKQRFCILIY